VHPLVQAPLVREIARAATGHLGRPWQLTGFTDLDDRASHRCGVLHGAGLDVFAKLDLGPRGFEQFTAELRGLELLRERAAVRTPLPVAEGVIPLEHGAVLLLEAVPEGPPRWREVGRSLATLHQVTGERFGLADFDGFFGPLAQDNRPVRSPAWTDFYAERRLLPRLRSAVDSGHLPTEVAARVERLIARLPQRIGPEPRPSLLHGDAQQNNFLTGPDGPVLIDVAPYFGHPEIDLALIDYFAPVPPELFDGYREVAPIDPGFGGRRELWRLFAYLAVVTVDGGSDFGRPFVRRIVAAVDRYR
jgi:fructosamine-3-kinase